MLSTISSIDTHVLQTLFAARTPGMTLAFIWVSEFGSAITIIGLSVALALWLGMKMRFALAQGVLLAVVTSSIGVFLAKMAVGRARPPVSFWAYTESGYSFPSAHATLAIAFYGFLAFLTWQSGATLLRRRLAILGATLITLAIGFSRLYLGVHYLSDVVGGYILGALCLWLAVWTTRMLQGRLPLK